MFKRVIGLFVVAACIALGTGLPALAQSVTGTLVGTVKDDQGLVIPGATVSLTSDTRGTKGPELVTSEHGDFVFVNVNPDTYTIEVSMPGFKTLKRSAIQVTTGDRVSLGVLTISVGELSETITVSSEAPLMQANSGERSYTATKTEIENLPMSNRSFTGLSALAPGVVGTATTQQGDTATTRVGSTVAENNYVMDGVSTMDTGSNRPLIQLNTEAIEEVKVMVSGYQAEYGRSTGLQIIATTKSGSNRFRGSLYDVERNSSWNNNSRTNILNGDKKPIVKQRDLGYTIGGPVGKPGGGNKLFFFYAQEFGPRTGGGTVARYRVPTALERVGDFSQSTDQNGAFYPYIKDPSLPGACSATTQAGCFADGGVLGRIPANRLYSVGMAILRWYPQPSVTNVPAGQAYNLEVTKPTQTLVSWQPTVRLDYQPTSKLRATFKMSAWAQQNVAIGGSVPGFNDTTQAHPFIKTIAVTANYAVNSTTFLEAVVGIAGNEGAGCALNGGAGGTGAELCNAGLPVNPSANMVTAGFGALPRIYPDANLIDPRYYAYHVFNDVIGDRVPIFDRTTGRLMLPPTFAYGARIATANAPPAAPYPGYLNINRTMDVSISLSKLAGAHTLKTGFYRIRSFKAQGSAAFAGAISFANDTVGTNPFDTSFGFANAAIGSLSSYSQPAKLYESNGIFTNVEGYVQDSWKVNNRLTLDYGVRFVHQTTFRDELGQQSNWDASAWSRGSAPRLYVPGCANGVYPCSGTNRQAMNSATGQFMGSNSSVLIGTIVPNTGNIANGIRAVPADQLTYKWPAVAAAPRFGMAYDLAGNQKIIVRGGVGLFFNRPSITTAIGNNNPPLTQTTVLQYTQLQSLGSGLSLVGVPAITGSQDQKLPASTQWNSGVQMLLPRSMVIDVGYMGNHTFNTAQLWNLNSIDLGAAYLPQNQDLTLAASTVPGANVLTTNLIRPYPGLSTVTISQADSNAWSTFHSIQLSLQRRMRNGLSFGFNDTISLYYHRSTTLRLQHAADGTASVRSDQAQADELLGIFIPQTQIMKGNFVWDLPDLRGGSSLAKVVGPIVNDWQWSGVWTGTTAGTVVYAGQTSPTTIGTAAYSAAYTYTTGGSVTNLTGSPDFVPRVAVVGDPGSGCSSDPLRQFNTAAFQGPTYGSVGLESGDGYLRGCFQSVFDSAFARNIKLGGGRNIQIRFDVFNLLNQAHITGANATMTLASPAAPAAIQNLPFDAAGNVIAARAVPKGAGFGVANTYQFPRSVQIHVRFSF